MIMILELSFTVTEGFCARREDRDQLAAPYSLTQMDRCTLLRAMMDSEALFGKFEFSAKCLWSLWNGGHCDSRLRPILHTVHRRLWYWPPTN